MTDARRSNTVRLPHAGAAPSGRWFDIVSVLLFAGPIYGTFFPPESYFGTWGVENAVEVLPYPITPVILVIESLFAAWLMIRLRIRGRVTHEPLAYIFVALAFASIVLSSDPQFSFQRALRLLPLVALAVIYAQLLTISKLLRIMTIAFVISAMLSIFVSIALPGYGRAVNMVGAYATAWRGATSHKNTAGYIYALGVIVAIFAYALRAVDWRLAGATVLGCLVMVVMANSATALLGMIATLAMAGIIAMIWRLPRGAGPLIAVTLLLFAAAAIFLLEADPQLSTIFTGRDATLSGRTDIWDPVIDAIERQPFTGHGYAFWQIQSLERDLIWRRVGYTPPHSHNSWLDLLLQLGVGGFICMALLAVSGIARAGYGAMVKRSTLDLMALSILFFVLSRSFTEVQFTEPGIVGVFWLVLASVLTRRS